MIGSSSKDVTPAGTQTPPSGGRRQALAAAARRYALAALGPLTISAAHFAASILFLKLMAPAVFGLFAFVLVVVPFWLSISVALLGAPLATTRQRHDGAEDWRELPTLLKANLLFSLAATLFVAATMAASGADPAAAALLGLYGGVMCVRWFARWLSYATHHPLRAVLSDVAYGMLLVAGLLALMLLHVTSMTSAALVLAISAAAGLAVFGRAFLVQQIRAVAQGTLAAYRPIWRDLTQWALLGVVTTELSANAHAYLVTLLSGPKSFALIAAGSLFMRPVSLCLTALPDRERPLLVRTLMAGDHAAADRQVREFRGAAAAIWLLTLALSAAALAWFPSLILKPDYDRGQVVVVVILWAAIMAVRSLRTPEAVLLQAAREFKPLASASVWASVVSLGLTAGLLLAFGPVASLLGILAGDAVMTERIFALVRRWKRTQRWRLAPAV
jgi:O-antigen/teichoic acid export membrane protein